MANNKERSPGLSSAEIEKYLDILAKDPNSRVFAPLAEAYRKAGFLDDAVEIALEGLKVHPNYLGGRVALGRAYFEKKQYAEAAAEMQKVAKSAPDNIIAHKVLGQIAYGQSDLPAAEKAFKMVLLLDPRDQEAQQFVAKLAGTSPPAPPPPAPRPPMPPQATQVVKPPPSPLPFDEIEAIDDLDLQVDDIFGAPETPPTTALPFAMEPLEEFGAEEQLDFSEPERLIPEPEPAPAPVPVLVPAPAPKDGMELEVFSRLAWGGEKEPEPHPSPATPAPDSGVKDEESPFEVFGRPKRGGPPHSSKGEQVAFGEIDIESAAHEPVRLEPEPASESPFEVFTREPGHRAALAPARAERGADAGPRELDIETTAYTLPDFSSPAGGVDAPVSLDEELPRIDLTQELDFGPLDEPAPSPAAPEPEFEPEPLASSEPDSALDLEVDLTADLETDEFAPPAAGEEISLHEEIPSIDLVEETPGDPFGEEDEDFAPVEEPAAASAERGVFDTETLASIYVNQGFYGRAAEIYQRLITQRPGDAGLRTKLEGVLALERAEAATEAPDAAIAAEVVEPPPAMAAAAQGEPVAATPSGPDRVISQLQTLLETFKGGRPR